MCRFALVPLLVVGSACFAQQPAEALRPPMTTETARALMSEASSVNRLTAEGKLIFENSRQQLRWGQYCGNAMMLNDQGELRRAIRNASQALFLGQRDKDPNATAFAKRDLAVSYLYSGNLDIAERYARESVAIPLQHPDNNWNVRSVSFKTLGDVAARRGEWPKAIEHYVEAAGNSSGAWKRLVRVSLANAHLGSGDLSKARAIIDDLGSSVESPVREVLLRARGRLALKDGKPDQALGHFRELAKVSDENDGAYHRVWALEGEAQAHGARGDKAAAARALLAAIETAEKVRARFRSEEFKTGTFGEMQDVFAAAVGALIDSGDAERALEVSEAGRSRALLDLMRERVKQSDGKTIMADALARPVKPADLRKLLGPKDVVIQFHVVKDRTHAWIIRSDGIRAKTLNTGRDALRDMVRGFRMHVTERSPLARERAQMLHEVLIRPLELEAESNMIVVPHDALHLLPFQALHDGSRYLIEAAPVTYAPSSSVLAQILARRTASVVPKLVAFGNPDLGSSELSLPGAEREVNNLRALYSDASVFLNREATKARFLSEAPRYTLVHVAAHAEFDNVDPLYSRVRLSPTAGSLGVLEAHEIYRLNLSSTALMTLSACESGVVKITNGDEVWGFSRSFLSAGASALLLALWPVADESTDLLMTRFYQGMKQKGTREALREAQLEIIANPKFAHPFFWSPFVLSGDWR